MLWRILAVLVIVLYIAGMVLMILSRRGIGNNFGNGVTLWALSTIIGGLALYVKRTNDKKAADEKEFEERFKEHQEKSRQASAGMFKGGLADDSKQSAYLHTATHLLLAGLQKKYGKDVKQRGSNITPERLRFDFNLDHKMTKEEIEEIENFVNDAIAKEIPVVCKTMTVEEAKAE